MDFQGVKFDVILANDTLSHCGDRDNLVKKLAKMLADEGLILITEILQSPNAP